jgi:hypothetical protein
MGIAYLGYLKFKTFYVDYIYIKYFKGVALLTQKFSLNNKRDL